MSGNELILVQCAVGSRDNAAAIARALVERRLAACVQMTPIESWYRWEGAVQHEPELMLTIKTVRARFDALCAAVTALHDYELPEIVAVPITDALPAYADWVREAVADAV